MAAQQVGTLAGALNGHGDRAPGFPLTDAGNAERLVAMHGDAIRYVPGLGWLEFDGRRWARDDTGGMVRRAKVSARAILHDAANCADDDERKRMVKWSRASESEPRLRAAVSLAATEQPVIARVDDLDRDAFLLSVENGTVDLRTGKLRAAIPVGSGPHGLCVWPQPGRYSLGHTGIMR